jgi:hypothetical protein
VTSTIAVLLAAAGCGTGSEFDYAAIGPQLRSCPSCGFYLQLRGEPVTACEVSTSERRIVALVYSAPTPGRVYTVTESRVEFQAQRCSGAVCEPAIGGTIEIVSISPDRVHEIRWALELFDGSRDEGTAGAVYCEVDSPPR